MKRLTLFLGHYGSGKTNLAVNWAMKAAEEGKKVEIADLDIVNPYFRTKDSQKELEAAGVPSILIPSPNVAENHQYFNAKVLADREAALLIEEKDLTGETLTEAVK